MFVEAWEEVEPHQLVDFLLSGVEDLLGDVARDRAVGFDALLHQLHVSTAEVHLPVRALDAVELVNLGKHRLPLLCREKRLVLLDLLPEEKDLKAQILREEARKRRYVLLHHCERLPCMVSRAALPVGECHVQPLIDGEVELALKRGSLQALLVERSRHPLCRRPEPCVLPGARTQHAV